jgi:hypothetical protein
MTVFREELQEKLTDLHAMLNAYEQEQRGWVDGLKARFEYDEAEEIWAQARKYIAVLANEIEETKRELAKFDQPQPQRRTGMNYSSAVFLINKNVRAIKVTYDKQDPGKAPASEYTFKTLDPAIAKDDFVVVPTDTRHGLTVVKVSQVDVDIDLDDAITQYKWIVARVDRSAYDQTLLDEAQAVKVIRLAEFNKKRSDLREGMLGASMDEIKALPIAALNGPTTTPKALT